MNMKLRLAMIYGSVRPNRFCDTVALWAASEIERHPDFALEAIDPRPEWPDLDEERLVQRIADADALAIVTPEYNHSYPGPLKVLIDATGGAWARKPVAFISYGGVSGGLRAVEHLRAVVAELNAVAIRDVISFQNVWESFGPQGRPIDDFRHSRSMRMLLSQLGWWAQALKLAREDEAYGEAA